MSISSRSQETALTREALLDVAEDLLAKGPEALTLRALGAQLGLSSMTPYGYFSNKAELCVALRGRGYRKLGEMLTLAGPVEDAAGLQRLAQAYAEFARAHRFLFALMFDGGALPAELGGDGGVLSRIETALEGWFASTSAEQSRRMALIVWASAHGAVGLELSGFSRPSGAGAWAVVAAILARSAGAQSPEPAVSALRCSVG